MKKKTTDILIISVKGISKVIGTKCGTKFSHQQGVKCTSLKCPDCGHIMI